MPSRQHRGSYEDLSERIMVLELQGESLEAEVMKMQHLLENQQVILETLRKKQLESQQQAKDLLHSHKEQWEHRETSLDSEVKTFQTFAKEAEKSLKACKEKIAHLESECRASQTKNQQLEATLHTLLEGLDLGETSGETHIVQQGDTLDKIALRYKTTVKALKETNGLTSDKILVGKKLIIPQSSLASR